MATATTDESSIQTQASDVEKLKNSMDACIKHAGDLIVSARAVQAVGNPHVAFHLAVLALEELGRRELYGIKSVAERHDESSKAWLEKQTQNHVKKLFWCFFGANFFEKQLTKEALDSITGLATHLHERRMEGLYVSQGDGTLVIPSETIESSECENILRLAEARHGIASNEVLRQEVSVEGRNLQTWFLGVSDDLEKRRFIFSRASMAKLAELKNAQDWTHWLKQAFDKQENENLTLAQREIERSQNVGAKGTFDKWKVKFRILSGSHSIRQKELNDWNSKVSWIKLTAVQGKKNELIVELILRDNVPVHSLWYFAWGVARQFVVALNIGTLGFWWWQLPEQFDKYYESIEDLELKSMLKLVRQPSLKVDWGENRVLTEADLNQVIACIPCLSDPSELNKSPAFNFYIGGLTFLSLNDVHWQCENSVFGNFFESIREMMAEVGDWERGAPFGSAIRKYVGEFFSPDVDIEKCLTLYEAFDAKATQSITITLKDASFAKAFCDAYFLQKYRPFALKKILPAAEVAQSGGRITYSRNN